MASSPETADFVLDQLGPLGRTKRMFGEFGIYMDGTFVGLICDDEVYLKPTAATAGFEVGTPYPNAKPHPKVPAEILEDAEEFRRLALETAALL